MRTVPNTLKIFALSTVYFISSVYVQGTTGQRSWILAQFRSMAKGRGQTEPETGFITGPLRLILSTFVRCVK